MNARLTLDDDAYTSACDALEDDEDFCLAFLEANWGAVINLITGADFDPTLRLAERRELRQRLYAAERDELKQRMEC